MQEITSLDDVVDRLQAHKGRWLEVAKETGVPYSTLAKIAQGKRKNPTLANFQALARWAAANEPVAPAQV